MTIFVSTDWLMTHGGSADIAIIDGSWHLPPTGRNARAEYEAAHIPGAIFFDIDAVPPHVAQREDFRGSGWEHGHYRKHAHRGL